MPRELPYAVELGFDGLLGLVLTEATDDLVSGVLTIRDELMQPAGLIHGGVYAAVAESLASLGTALVVARDGNVAQGMSNQSTFMRPILHGAIHATARARHRGRTTWVWDVEACDDEGRACALSRVTIAVRPAPPGVDVATMLARWLG